MKCRMMRHFIWVFTVCQSTHVEITSIYRINPCHAKHFMYYQHFFPIFIQFTCNIPVISMYINKQKWKHQMTSKEAAWFGSKLFSIKDKSGFSKTKVKIISMPGNFACSMVFSKLTIKTFYMICASWVWLRWLRAFSIAAYPEWEYKGLMERNRMIHNYYYINKPIFWLHAFWGIVFL